MGNSLFSLITRNLSRIVCIFGLSDIKKGCAEIPDRASDNPLPLEIVAECTNQTIVSSFSKLDASKGILSIGDSFVRDIPGLSVSYHCICADFPKEKQIRSVFYLKDPYVSKWGDHFLIEFEDGSAYAIDRDLNHKLVGLVSSQEFQNFLTSGICNYLDCPVRVRTPYRMSASYYESIPKDPSNLLSAEEGIVSVFSNENTYRDFTRKNIIRGSFLFNKKNNSYRQRFISVNLKVKHEEYQGRIKPEKVLLVPFTLVIDILTSPFQLLWILIAFQR